MIDDNKFKCDCCQVVYDKGRSDEEAMAESEEIWGTELVNSVPMSVICDDCFNKMNDYD